MRIGNGQFTFEWLEDFAEIPYPDEAARGWAHHGIAVSSAGTLLTFHPARSTVLELTTDGKLVRTMDVPLSEAHGVTICTDGRNDCLWFADNGRKRQPYRGLRIRLGTESRPHRQDVPDRRDRDGAGRTRTPHL